MNEALDPVRENAAQQDYDAAGPREWQDSSNGL